MLLRQHVLLSLACLVVLGCGGSPGDGKTPRREVSPEAARVVRGVFLIRDNRTNAILFLGRVADPSVPET